MVAASPAAAKPSDPLKCQLAILKETSKLVKARSTALRRCEEAKVKGKHGDTCPDAGAERGSPARKAADQIARAAAKLHAAVARKCGGDDGTCGTADDAENPFAPADIGFASCPDFEGACAGPIADCAALATCVECVGMDATDQLVGFLYDDLVPSDPRQEKKLNRCQVTIGKEAVKYALAKEKILAKCWLERFKGKHAARCPDLTADPKTAKAAVKAARQIAKAESRKIVKICKACGGPDKRCDDAVATITPGLPAALPGSGGGDDPPLDAITDAGECPSVLLPATPGRAALTCARPLATVADLVFCLDCVAEFEFDCLDPARVPALAAYPDPECSIGVCSETDLGSALPVSQAGSTAGAPSEFESTCGGTGPEVVLRWTPPSTNRYRISTVDAGTSFDTVLSVRDLNCAGPELTCNDDAGGSQSQVALLPAIGGRSLGIVVDGFLTFSSGSFVLTIAQLPAAGGCCGVNAANPGCDQSACQSCVCEQDPACCNVEWGSACAARAANQCGAFCLGCTGPGDCPAGMLCANGTCHCPFTCLAYHSPTGTCIGASSNLCSPPLDDSGMPCTP